MRGGRSLEQASGRGHRGLFGGLPGPQHPIAIPRSCRLPSWPRPRHQPPGSSGQHHRQSLRPRRTHLPRVPQFPGFPGRRCPSPDAQRSPPPRPAPWRPLPAHTQRAPCIPAAARNIFLIPCRPCRNSCKKCSESRSRPSPAPYLPGPFRLLWF